MKIKLKMELLSDAIPGSGNSLAGVIDREISYDKFGFPYIPAKRIKGILRESAEDLQLPQDRIKEIFGYRGSDKGCPLIIDNGLLPKLDELKANLLCYNKEDKKKTIGKEDVLGFYSYTRAQTTIGDDGVAKEKSLRISRVLKKGLNFCFQVELPPEFVKDFEKICKVTRSFGSSRNRGFGEIKLTIEESSNDSKNKAKTTTAPEQEFGKIVLELENKSQILVSNKVGMSQISDDYIGGNFILGALAHKYIKQNGVDATFKELFLSGEVRFGNLYPAKKNGKSKGDYYPAPLSIKKIKSSKVSGFHMNQYLDLSDWDSDDKELKNIRLKGSFPGFVSLHNNKITVNREIESHHARPENRAIAKAKEGDGEFYQFEVIEPNHHFKGEIRGSTANLIEVKKLLDSDNVLRLGKSKTGQYAKCVYQPVKIEGLMEESFTWHHEDEVKFIAQSDILLYNENGYPEPTTTNFIANLADSLNIDSEKLLFKRGFVKKSEIGGFVGVWKLPKIQVPVISAGSVFVLKNCGENIELPTKIIFLGDRIEEGYGRIVISDDVCEKKAIHFEIEEEESPSIDQCAEFDKLVDHYIKVEMERYLTSEAIKKGTKRSNSSTVARLKRLIVKSESFAEFSAELDKLNTKTQEDNLRKFNDLLYLNMINKRIEIDQNNFLHEILNLAGYPDDFKKQVHDNSFRYYKIYVKNLLEQIKLNNRGI